jgi:hypothetical protein
VLVSGPVGTLLVAGVSVVALLVWLVRRPRHPGPRLVGHDGIDRVALEAAEREVRDLESPPPADEGLEGDDWGPGAARPRPPVRL